MLNINATRGTEKESPLLTNIKQMEFSLSGKTMYIVSDDEIRRATVRAWDVANEKFIAKKNILQLRTTWHMKYVSVSYLAVVKEGVVLSPKDGTLELWNFELNECIRMWPNLRYITEMMPISEKRVACVGKENDMNVLDTTRPEVAPIPFSHEGYESTILRLEREAIACNRRCQLLSTDRHSVQLSDDSGRILWRKPWSDSLLCSYSLPGMFSPTELLSPPKLLRMTRVCISSMHRQEGHSALCVELLTSLTVNLSMTTSVSLTPKTGHVISVFDCLTLGPLTYLVLFLEKREQTV